MNDLSPLVQEARDEFERAHAPADLENAKARYLGKAGRITEQLKGLAALPVDEKTWSARSNSAGYCGTTSASLLDRSRRPKPVLATPA